MQPQILIVGAGPTGLALALTLLKSGVRVRIIDKAQTYNGASKGAGTQPRIQEIEHFLGTLPDLRSISSPPSLFFAYDAENPRQVLRKTNVVESADPTPQFPITSMVWADQYLHEGVLRKHVEAFGGKVELSTELSAFEQDDKGVKAHLTKIVHGKEIQETAEFLYVVGADGGRSSIRKMLGLQFIGETFEREKLLTSDIDLKGLDGYAMHGFTGNPSLFVLFRSTNVPERYQLLMGGHAFADMADECINAGPEKFQKIINKVTNRTDLQLLKIHNKFEWKYNTRMVDHFQRGRVFVAGDAAHTHSPMGGQGMTSGIQDAFNVAWKLALAVKGLASPTLLASYEEERLPAIADMLLASAKLHRVAYGEKKDGDSTKEDGVKRTVDALGSVAAPLTAVASIKDKKEKEKPLDQRFPRDRKLWQLDLNYRWSSIVLDERFAGSECQKDAYGKTRSDLRAGDRAPDAPGLLVLHGKGSRMSKVSGKEGEDVRLFDIFDPTVHTALIFSPAADTPFVSEVHSELQKLPSGLIRSVLIVPKGSAAASGTRGADLLLADKEGHAYHGYELKEEANAAVIIRPDAMIGAFVQGPAGVKKYFAKVFNSA